MLIGVFRKNAPMRGTANRACLRRIKFSQVIDHRLTITSNQNFLIGFQKKFNPFPCVRNKATSGSRNLENTRGGRKAITRHTRTVDV
jgi:hypothetical protein